MLGSMRFIKTVQEITGLGIRELSRAVSQPHSKLLFWRDSEASKMNEFVGFLCRLRKISGLSWSKYGKMLDGEFLDTSKKGDKK